MAPTTTSADPLKSLEGMWNGSLIRLANYFKDPAGYGQQTQTVLRETAKRYQDALDDCEIQILEAKWYLERELAFNRARRAQRASESTPTANKRKLGSVDYEQQDNTKKLEENPAKRIKVLDSKKGDASTAENEVARAEETATRANDGSGNINIEDEPPRTSEETAKENIHGTDRPVDGEESNQPTVPAPKKSPDVNNVNATKPISTDFTAKDEPKTSGPATSIDENQGFNFDSMFDDSNDGGNDNNGDLGFDMDLSSDPFPNVIHDRNDNGQANNSGSLDSLLPGLENYANQTGDDMMNFNSSNAGGAAMDGATGVQSDMFDLPDLGDSNFNDLLNDDSLGGAVGGGGDDMLNDDTMMNFEELDDSFFNI